MKRDIWNSGLIRGLRATRIAHALRIPFRRMFRRIEDHGFTRDHQLYFLKRVKGIIHVGASIGQERGTYALFGKPVVWIEPIPDAFRTLSVNIGVYPSQRAFQALLSDESGSRITLHVSNHGGVSSSIFALAQIREIWPDVEYERSLELTTITLDDLMDEERIPRSRYDAIILDTQGSELLALRGAVKTLASCRWVLFECADFEAYAGACQCAEIEVFLRDLGFVEKARYLHAEKAGVGRYFDLLYWRP